MSVEKHFFFAHQVDQYVLYIHEAKAIFQRFLYKRFTSKFKQIFMKKRLIGLKLQIHTLPKEMRSLHTLIRTIRACIYPQYCVLLGSILSKLNEFFCNYKETFYVLVTILTLFYLVVCIYQQFYVMF